MGFHKELYAPIFNYSDAKTRTRLPPRLDSGIQTKRPNVAVCLFFPRNLLGWLSATERHTVAGETFGMSCTWAERRRKLAAV